MLSTNSQCRETKTQEKKKYEKELLFYLDLYRELKGREGVKRTLAFIDDEINKLVELIKQMKNKIDALKERYITAKSQSEHQEIQEELCKLCDENAVAVADAALESIRDTNAMLLREKLKDVLPIMSVSYLTKTYFDKSPQWFYQRLNGNAVNGKSAQFTSTDLKILHGALLDISPKISASASVVF